MNYTKRLCSKMAASMYQSKFSVLEPVHNTIINLQRSPLLLGSGSASRRSILENAGYKFDIIKAEIDERAIGDRSDGKDATNLVIKIAHAKADAIMETLKETCTEEYINKYKYLLTCDQVVVCNNEILEKPLNESEAREMLSRYGTYNCNTIGSLVLTNIHNGKRYEKCDSSTINFNSLNNDTINNLITQGEIFYCAGSLMIENPLMLPYIINVVGSESSVMGLNIIDLNFLFIQAESQLYNSE
jgi:septum formation protein